MFAPEGAWQFFRFTIESGMVGLWEVFSAGRDAPALLQARTPAATGEREKIHFADAHFRREIEAQAF